MDTNRISEQAKRENLDPREGVMPIPFRVLGLVGVMVVTGILIILSENPSMPPETGDSRVPEELVPKAAAAPMKGAVLDGAPIFAARCAACHQASGAGLPGVFPPLAGSEWVTGKDDVLAKILLQGVTGALSVKGATYNGAMPAFKEQLGDDEIAAVATHVRSQWGNQVAAVSPEVIAKARADTASRSAPWNGDTELGTLK